MNIARLFSYTRAIEKENAELKDRILKLEDRLEARTSYAFALTGRPTQEMVEKRQEVAAGERGNLQPVRQRANLRLLRREALAKVIARREPEEKSLDLDGMKDRADSFAEKVKANG